MVNKNLFATFREIEISHRQAIVRKWQLDAGSIPAVPHFFIVDLFTLSKPVNILSPFNYGVLIRIRVPPLK